MINRHPPPPVRSSNITYHVLSGHLLLGTPHTNNNTQLDKLNSEIQEKFLSICNNFVCEGEQ